MPIYDFRCQECGKVSEVFVRSINSQAVCCPDCGSGKMEKMITASYAIRTDAPSSSERTCCGRTERCERPPCSTSDTCSRQ